MKLFHAVSDLTLVDRYYDIININYPHLAKLNILISYTFFDHQLPILQRLKQEGKIDSTFLDAGTFGDNPGGCNPGLVDNYDIYLAWIIDIGAHFDYISSFDDRFNEPDHNRLNYEDLRNELGRYDAEHGTQLAAKLVPVIHSPEPTGGDDDGITPAEEFLGYIEDGATTIGIGSKPMISPRGMEEIKELVYAHNVRIHRFGNFDFKFIARWQIESADSGRYFRSAQFGKEVWFWDSQENRPVRWDLRSSAPLPEEYRHTLDHVFGWTVNDLLGGDVSNIWLVNIFSHQQMQHYLTATLGI